jgi:hypothetical protein
MAFIVHAQLCLFKQSTKYNLLEFNTYISLDKENAAHIKKDYISV